MLDFHQVACFVAVAEERSFTRAATRLSISQPWLSTQVRKLETQIGFRLLLRSTRHVSLTPDGERLFEAAARLVREQAQLDDVARSLRIAHEKQVILGIPAYSHAIPEHIQILEHAFKDRPGHSVSTVEGDTASLLRRLEDDEIDAAFVTGAPDARTLDIITLRPLDEVLAIPVEHPLARYDIVPARALAGVTISVPERKAHPYIHTRLDGVTAAGGQLMEMPEVQMPTRIMLAARLGLPTVLPRCIAEAHKMLTPGIELRPCEALRSDGNFYLVRRKGQTAKAGRAFWRSAQNWAAARNSLQVIEQL